MPPENVYENTMANKFALLVLLVNLTTLKGEDEFLKKDNLENHRKRNEGPSYSFSYGVADAQTGDVKTVWESKNGDTVEGAYSYFLIDNFINGNSILTVRTVEYSAGPGKGFIAAVNNDGVNSQPQIKEEKNMEDKSYRDYKRPYELSEDANYELYSSNYKKNKKRTYDPFKDYPMTTRATYNTDSYSSEYPYIPPLKHFRDEILYNGETHSHMGFGHDPDCKTKYATEGTNYFKTLSDLDFRKQKYPLLYSDPYKHDKYKDLSNDDSDTYMHYKFKGQHKSPRPDEIGLATSIKYSYPLLPDMPVSEHYYQDVAQRPKKKHRPYKPTNVFYSNEDLNDYVLVPKKKHKKPPRLPDISDYSSDIEDDYDHPDEDDDRNYKPLRGSGHKEVVKKIIKKPKPTIIKLLDILDI